MRRAVPKKTDGKSHPGPPQAGAQGSCVQTHLDRPWHICARKSWGHGPHAPRREAETEGTCLCLTGLSYITRLGRCWICNGFWEFQATGLQWHSCPRPRPALE